MNREPSGHASGPAGQNKGNQIGSVGQSEAAFFDHQFGAAVALTGAAVRNRQMKNCELQAAAAH